MRRNTGAVLAGQQLGELLSPEAAGLRWFLLPAEAQAMHKGQLPAASSPPASALALSLHLQLVLAELNPGIVRAPSVTVVEISVLF